MTRPSLCGSSIRLLAMVVAAAVLSSSTLGGRSRVITHATISFALWLPRKGKLRGGALDELNQYMVG